MTEDDLMKVQRDCEFWLEFENEAKFLVEMQVNKNSGKKEEEEAVKAEVNETEGEEKKEETPAPEGEVSAEDAQ
jgi:hypothetical protein